MAFYPYAEALRNAYIITRGIARAMKKAGGEGVVRVNFSYEWYGIMKEDCFDGREPEKWLFKSEVSADNDETRRVRCVSIDYESSSEAEDLIRKSVLIHNADGKAFAVIRRFNRIVGKTINSAIRKK